MEGAELKDYHKNSNAHDADRMSVVEEEGELLQHQSKNEFQLLPDQEERVEHERKDEGVKSSKQAADTTSEDVIQLDGSNSTLTAARTIKDTTERDQRHLCPRGHILEKYIESIEGGTCDICHCSLHIGDECLGCHPCQGFVVCHSCTNNYVKKPEYITSVNHHTAGMIYFDQGSYSCAVEEFKKSLNLREVWTTKHRPMGFSVSALAAEMLAKAQYLGGDIDAALQSCTSAMSYYESSGADWENEVALARRLLEDMKVKSQWIKEGMENIQKESNFSGVSYSSHKLRLPGVSVYHLQTTFMAHIRLAKLNENSNIHEIENLQGPPGVIRRRGASVVCPVDGKKGAAYVNCLDGEDNVGEATHMLSYSWSYKIGDIVDSLTDFCKTHNLDPKRTYIWICCLCINQHRVVQQKECGGTGMLNFEEEFPRKLKTIGHMLAMMAPWRAPFYLTRLWCVFEMYAAHANGCKVDIVVPPKEKESLEQDVIGNGKGINALYEALGNTNVQNADATVPSDKKVIMGMIESTVGCQVLNNEVNKLLRGWMKKVLLQLVENRGDANDERYATKCAWVGGILSNNGEYNAALEQCRKCLAIRERVLGTHHPQTAASYHNIGSVLCDKGDYDGALEKYQKCLAIFEVVLGTNHPSTATTYNNIGLVLYNKGDYDCALAEYRKCLAISEAVLGTNHPSTATTYNNIGLVLRNKGEYDGALEEYRKCLAIREVVLGTNHPSTATTYNNIGLVLYNKGDYDGALAEYRKCLSIQEAVLGTDHPSTATTYNNIGMLLYSKGACDGALEAYRKCLAIQEAVLGTEHPSTATTYNNIRMVLYSKGDCDGALE